MFTVSLHNQRVLLHGWHHHGPSTWIICLMTNSSPHQWGPLMSQQQIVDDDDDDVSSSSSSSSQKTRFIFLCCCFNFLVPFALALREEKEYILVWLDNIVGSFDAFGWVNYCWRERSRCCCCCGSCGSFRHSTATRRRILVFFFPFSGWIPPSEPQHGRRRRDYIRSRGLKI